MQFRESHDQVLQLVTCTVHSCESSENGSPGLCGTWCKVPPLIIYPKYIYHPGCHEDLRFRGMQNPDYMIRIRVLPPTSDKCVLRLDKQTDFSIKAFPLVAVSNVDQMPSWPKPSRCCRSPCLAGPQRSVTVERTEQNY
jgi:hypothetical protein